MNKKIAVTLLLGTLNVGCATIHSTTQAVEIKTNNEKAEIYVNDKHIGTHETAMLFKNKNDYLIKAVKQGCKPIEIKAEKEFDRETLLGTIMDFTALNKFKSNLYNLEIDCTPIPAAGVLVPSLPPQPTIKQLKTPYLTQTVTTTLKAKISPKETIKPAPKEPQVTVSSKKIDTLASKEPKVDLNPKQPTDQSKSLGTIETELDAIFN